VIGSLEPDPDEVGTVGAIARQRRHVDEAVTAAETSNHAGAADKPKSL